MTVVENAAPDAGGDRLITICSTDAPFALTPQLNGTPDSGGQWVGPNGPITGDVFNPDTAPGGTWIYSVVGTPPCANASAQLTVILRQAPDAGISSVVTTCSNSPSFALIDELGGSPDLTGSWTAPGGAVFNGTFIPGSSVPGVHTYTVTGQSPCAPATATVTVSVVNAPDAGAGSALQLCSNAAAVSLFSQLGGSPDAGGAWTDPDGAPFGASFDASTDEAGIYTYTVQGTSPCAASTAVVTVGVTPAPDAGSSASNTVCTNAPAFALIGSLGGTPAVNGSWTGPNALPVPGGQFTPGTSLPGTYTYTVPGFSPCTSAVATVSVSQSIAPNAGVSTTLSVCSDAAPVPLLPLLGAADPGGAWTRPGGQPHSGVFQPGIDPSGLYTYTVPGVPPCSSASAAVSITVQPAPRAGIDGTVTVCSNTGAFPLLPLLGGAPQATGSWTGPDGAAFPTGSFIPGQSLPGVYTYVVPGIPPCGPDSSSLTVNVQQAPSAGFNGDTLVCGNASSFALASVLGGVFDVNGTWTGPGNTPHGPVYVPATDGPGIYTYTVTGLPPCAAATALVLVQEQAPPNAGSNGAITVCSTAQAFPLFSLLGGAPSVGGSWSGPGGAMNGAFIPGTSVQGIYTYTVAGITPCASASATVTVTVNPAPFAGGDGALTVCSGSGAFNLFPLLQPAPSASNGTWTDLDGTGQFSGTVLQTNGLGNGLYRFRHVLPASGQCAGDTAFVLVTIVQQLDAGSNGFSTVCGSSTAIQLFGLLNGTPDLGGNWVDQDNTNALVNGVFNASLVAPGTYDFAYELDGGGTCPDDESDLTLVVVGAADAGLNADTLVCGNGSAFQLLSVLGGSPDAGGAWSGPSPVVAGQYIPSSMSAGAYTYSVEGAGPCPDVAASVTVAEVAPPNAGQSRSIAVCENDAPFTMTDSLGGTPQPTGVWQDPGGLAHSSLFLPGIDPSGGYSYTVHGAFPCASAVAVLTVAKSLLPDAGIDGQAVVCDNGGPLLLSSLLGGTPDPNGTWSGPNGLATDVLFDPQVDPPGAYRYIVPPAGACEGDTATVVISVQPAPNAGAGTSTQVCASSAPVNLLPLLVGADAGGVWTGPLGQVFGGVFNPAVDLPGLYTYTVQGPSACLPASASVLVSVVTPNSAGTSTALLVCSSEPCFPLFTRLGGAPVLGGAWTGPNGADDGIFCPGTDVPGIYIYSVTGPSPCPALSATVTIGVSPAVNAGGAATVSVCDPGPTINLFTALSGNPQPGGFWLGPGGQPFSGLFQSSINAGGAYTYVVPGAGPCPSDSALVTVIENNAPDAGGSGVVIVCDDELPFGLLDVLLGSPNLNGTWTDPNGSPTTGLYFPGSTLPGVYTYSVTGAGACSLATATVTVIENQQPFAGADALVQVCSTNPPLPLLPLLSGAEPGGTWLGPGNTPFSGTYVTGSSIPGTYTYVLAGTAPCVNDTAQVQVFEQVQPDPGVSAAVSLCTDAPPVVLLGLLVGNPDPGGSWTGPNGPVASGVFDPASDPAGAYVYSIATPPPCTTPSATVFISLQPAPSAGIPGTLTVCLNAPAVNLFAGLDGAPQPGGAWVNTSGLGALTGGTWNASGVPAGSYTFTYTVAGLGPCADDQSSVTVQVVQALNAGCDAQAEFCESETFVDLVTLLDCAPQAGGLWQDLDASGAMLNGVFNAALAGQGIYEFLYILPGSGACLADSALLEVTVVEGPNAGCSAVQSVCSSASAFTLFQFLNSNGCIADANGVWTAPDGLPFSGQFDPATDNAGVYTYVVPAIGSCQADTATVTVIVEQAPFAGTDATLGICSSADAVSLISLLPGADAGGAWFGPGNVPSNGIYNPALNNPGLYVYNVLGSPVCFPDQATVTVTEYQAVNAGSDNTALVCSSSPPFNLFSELGGNPGQGGSWLDPNGVQHGSTYTPGQDQPGAYTYVLIGPGTCANDSAVVLVDETPQPQAGAGGILPVCVTETAQDLFEGLLPPYTAGGAWIDVDATGALTGSLFNASAVGVGSFAFIHIVGPTAPCPQDTTLVIAVVSAGIDIGSGGVDTICASAPYDLFGSLPPGTDQSGTWTDELGTGQLNGSVLDAPQVPPGGSYPFTYTLQTAACGAVTVGIVLHVAAPPDAGTEAAVVSCINTPPVSLFGALGGTPVAGGSWTDPLGAPHGAFFDPAIDPAGAYIYTVPGVAPCASASATVTITVNAPPDAGADSSFALCNTNTGLVLFDALGGTPDPGGAWTELNSSGALTGGLLNTTVLDAGTYGFQYTVQVPGCAPDQSVVTLALLEAVDVSEPVLICNEVDRTYTVSFTISGGDPSTYTVIGLQGTLSTSPPFVFTTSPLITSQGFACSVTDANGCAVRVLEGVSPCSFEEVIFVPGLFSPNGDGINDAFLLPGIEGRPDNTVLIFNRWGAKVYGATGYDNTSVVWDGSGPGGDPLPSGTYFYVIDIGGPDQLKGYVYLNR